MTTSSIISMIIILTIFFGGFVGLILRLQKVSKEQEKRELEEEKLK
ncbi:MAG: hypothetical protein Q7K48_04465 [Fusobacterium sp. JB021]|nr:hypothetical protein [Fusobacterium sp. JB021]MDP0506135.1 hypothetical protein [Fusobacterium sp. JB019]